MLSSLISGILALYNLGMRFKQNDDIFAKHGWTQSSVTATGS
jgi:hypothetical protein